MVSPFQKADQSEKKLYIYISFSFRLNNTSNIFKCTFLNTVVQSSRTQFGQMTLNDFFDVTFVCEDDLHRRVNKVILFVTGFC